MTLAQQLLHSLWAPKRGDRVIVNVPGSPVDKKLGIIISETKNTQSISFYSVDLDHGGRLYLVKDELLYEPDWTSPEIDVETPAAAKLHVHQKGMTPISLEEKNFETWYVCKHCGAAMEPVDHYKKKIRVRGLDDDDLPF